MNKRTSRPLQGPTRVLVVVGQPMLADVVCMTLNHGVYAARVVRDGAEAAEVLDEWQPHLAVVDLDASVTQLIGVLGFDRGREDYVPVIALTRRDDLNTRLAAFKGGVDDLLTIPFSAEELLARALVVTRRHYGAVVAWNPVIHVGELEIDLLTRRVCVGSEELRLTALEQSLLYLLAANAGRPITRQEILDNVWGAAYAVPSKAVDRHVRDLRAKLQDHPRRPRFIATVPGKGYRFVPTLSQQQQASGEV